MDEFDQVINLWHKTKKEHRSVPDAPVGVDPEAVFQEAEELWAWARPDRRGNRTNWQLRRVTPRPLFNSDG